MTHVVASGHLFKMKRQPRNVFQQWNNRYFTIENLCLKWRSSEGKAESGSIPLNSVTGVRNFECGSKGAHSFIVESPERTLLLRAESEAEKDRWIRALEMQIDLVKGGNGGGMTSKGESTASQKKKRVDTSLETEIDKNMVLLNEVERVQKSQQEQQSGRGNNRSYGETKQTELKHRNDYHKVSRDISHSNDVIQLDENDISRDSF